MGSGAFDWISSGEHDSTISLEGCVSWALDLMVRADVAASAWSWPRTAGSRGRCKGVKQEPLEVWERKAGGRLARWEAQARLSSGWELQGPVAQGLPQAKKVSGAGPGLSTFQSPMGLLVCSVAEPCWVGALGLGADHPDPAEPGRAAAPPLPPPHLSPTALMVGAPTSQAP